MSKEIQLSNGMIAIVDDEDFEWASQYKWWCCNGYAVRHSTGKKSIAMHREIAKTPKGMVTDHANGNKLDNRRANLRAATRGQNATNSKLHSNNTSGYRGVTYLKRTNKWRAHISIDGMMVYLGNHDTPEKAANAYNVVARNHFGAFAKLNDIP